MIDARLKYETNIKNGYEQFDENVISRMVSARKRVIAAIIPTRLSRRNQARKKYRVTLCVHCAWGGN